MNRALLSCITLLSVASGCTSRPASPTHNAGQPVAPIVSSAAPELRKFDIAAGDARVALNEFSRQANLQVLFDFAALRDRQTHAVAGVLPPREALKSMLRDTGLSAQNVNERTLAITPDQ